MAMETPIETPRRHVPRSAWKMYERMNRTLAGYGEDDFDKLYRGFGFTPREGRDRVYTHKEHPDLAPALVGRHRSLSIKYTETALKRVGEVIRRESLSRENTRL